MGLKEGRAWPSLFSVGMSGPRELDGRRDRKGKDHFAFAVQHARRGRPVGLGHSARMLLGRFKPQVPILGVVKLVVLIELDLVFYGRDDTAADPRMLEHVRQKCVRFCRPNMPEILDYRPFLSGFDDSIKT